MITRDSKSDFMNRIRVRLFVKQDLESLRNIFEISFPVVYNEDFYQCLAAQFFKGRKIITYIAEYFDGVTSFSRFYCLGWSADCGIHYDAEKTFEWNRRR